MCWGCQRPRRSSKLPPGVSLGLGGEQHTPEKVPVWEAGHTERQRSSLTEGVYTRLPCMAAGWCPDNICSLMSHFYSHSIPTSKAGESVTADGKTNGKKLISNIPSRFLRALISSWPTPTLTGSLLNPKRKHQIQVSELHGKGSEEQ